LPLPIQQAADKEVEYIHPLAPKGSTLFVAPTNSGKTVLMINMILRYSFGYCFAYKTVHVFSPTLEQDQSWDTVRAYRPHLAVPPRGPGSRPPCKKKKGKKIQTAEIILHTSFSEYEIENILEEQDDLDPEERERTLLILDDVADLLPVHSNILQRLAFRGRHSKVYMWLSVQKYRRVELGMRVNFRYFVVFRVSVTELKAIWEELSNENRDDFFQLYSAATDPRYGFLTINMNEGLDERYTASFRPMALQS
jgi:hypothetical protein